MGMNPHDYRNKSQLTQEAMDRLVSHWGNPEDILIGLETQAERTVRESGVFVTRKRIKDEFEHQFENYYAK